MKKVIVIHQNDIKDCGPCCLQSIIKYYGGYVPIEKIREDTYVGNDGTNVYHLVNTLLSFIILKNKSYIVVPFSIKIISFLGYISITMPVNIL